MSETIPADVMAEAENVLADIRWYMIPVADFEHAKGIIARAILSERDRATERAAKIAEAFAKAPHWQPMTAFGIAAAIRNPMEGRGWP